MTIISVLAERPRHHDLLGLHTVGAVPVLDAPLDSLGRADLLIATAGGHMLGVVYLDIAGLLSAIRTKELQPRLIGVKQRWPWCYLVISPPPSLMGDGRLKNSRGESSGWSWEAVQGALLTVQEMGVPVLWIQHASLVPETLERLARRERGPVRAAPLRDGLFYSEAAQVLMALPGIGEAKADALIEYCGSAADALLALTCDAMDGPPGIGPETRRAARAALGLRETEALARTQLNDLPIPVAAPKTSRAA